MVQADHNAQLQAQMQAQVQAQARMAAQFAQSRPANMANQMPYAQGVRMPKGAANFPAFISMQSNLQSRMAQFPGGMNPGLSNFRQAGDQRWNTAANINTAARGYAQTSAPPPKTYTETPRQPVITEVDKEEGSNNAPEYTNSTTSSVVIEEIDWLARFLMLQLGPERNSIHKFVYVSSCTLNWKLIRTDQNSFVGVSDGFNGF